MQLGTKIFADEPGESYFCFELLSFAGLTAVANPARDSHEDGTATLLNVPSGRIQRL